MTDLERHEIATLAEVYETAKQRHQMLSLANQRSDPQERLVQSVEYHIADVERMQAWAALDLAKSRIGLKQS